MELPASNWFVDSNYWAANRSFIWSKKRIEMSAEAAADVSKLLNIKPGTSVLDLACGFGRYSLPLANLGFSVTGIDLNRSFVEEASGKAKEMNFEAQFECIDMREFSKPSQFDNIIIMYNSFSYFQNPEDDKRVVSNCFQSLKPGGKLLIQSVTREYLVAKRPNKYSRYWFEENDGTIRLEEASINDDWTWNTTKWILIKDNNRKEYTYGMRLYSTSEYIELFTSAGFVNPKTFGDLSGKHYDKENDILVLVLEKPDETTAQNINS